MTKMKMVVSGKVTRSVTVNGNSLAECEANAISEWASLLGGDYTTAEVLNASYIKEEDDEWKKYTVFFRPPPWTAPKSYQVETDTSKKAYDDAFCLLIDDVGFEEALEYECYAVKEKA